MLEVKYCDFDGHPLRYIEIDGKVWFVVQDLDGVIACAARNMVHKVLEKETEYMKISLPDFSCPNIRTQRVQISRYSYTKSANIKNHTRLIVSEEGLYKLLTTMRSPIAKKFKQWIATKMLSLRKNEYYQDERQEAGQDKIVAKKQQPMIVQSIGRGIVVEIPICDKTEQLLAQVCRLLGL